MPENQRPEYDAERTKAMEPVRPSGTASERTTQIAASSVQEAGWPQAEWPQEEPDTEAGAGSDANATVRNVTPPGPPANGAAPAGPRPNGKANGQANGPANGQATAKAGGQGVEATQVMQPAVDVTRALSGEQNRQAEQNRPADATQVVPADATRALPADATRALPVDAARTTSAPQPHTPQPQPTPQPTPSPTAASSRFTAPVDD
ncbi:hypothetical protein ACFP3R_34050, partial [Saccharothrix lopnurensis]